ncbi:MAG: hypothetical protein WC027_01420 [Candidatus Paceibacterota bacterium]
MEEFSKRTLEDGDALLKCTCPTCKWNGEEIFVIGDDERNLAYQNLEEDHAVTGCKSTLVFEEKQSK